MTAIARVDAVSVNNFPSVQTVTGSVLATVRTDQIQDAGNSSTTPLGVNAAFTGSWSSTAKFNSVHVTLFADASHTINVDQSTDGANVDLTDVFQFNDRDRNLGTTVQLVAAFYRVRAQNTDINNASVMRLASYQCPVSDPLPRALDTAGNLRTIVRSLNDSHGRSIKANPVGDMRVGQPYRLVGTAFSSGIDLNFWTTSSIGAGSSVVGSNGIVTLTASGSNGISQINSSFPARFIFGIPNHSRQFVRMPSVPLPSGSVARWGAFTTSSLAPGVPQDGFYFELGNAGLSLNCVNQGRVLSASNGRFNQEISNYQFDTSSHICEITYFFDGASFLIDDMLLHTFNPSTTMLSSIFHLPLSTHVTSSASSTTAEFWAGGILRLGRDESAQIVKRLAGPTSGLFKLGPGRLHSVTYGGAGNTATLTLYDGLNATGLPFLDMTFPANNPPNSMLFQLDFYTGLFIVTTGNTADFSVSYE